MASLLSSAGVTTACRLLHENKTWKALGVEVLGINLPKTAIVRNRDEAIDVGVNEFGNTVGFFGGVWGGGALIDKMLKRLRVPVKPNTSTFISQGRLMKSFLIIPPMFALLMAMPFFRNAYTAWRSGTTDYKTLITREQADRNSIQGKRKTREAVQRYLENGAAILLAGAGLGLAGFLWARSKGPFRLFTATGQKLIPSLNAPWFRKILNALCLTGKKATEYEDLRAVAYWGIPAYLGWMAASRDGFEVKEQLLKMANFIAVYFLTDKVVNRFFNRKAALYARKFPRLYPGLNNRRVFSYAEALANIKRQPLSVGKILRFENTRILSGFGMTVMLMAALPALINIYLTRQRLARAEATARQNLRQLLPGKGNAFSFKPFVSPLEIPRNSRYPYNIQVQ